jgi:hypothetical protein
MAAAWHEHHDDMIAREEIIDALSNRHNFARRLMAQGHRHGTRAAAVDHRKVGMAQASGFDPHQNLARPGGIKINLLHRERLLDGIRGLRAHSAQDGGFNLHSSSGFR